MNTLEKNLSSFSIFIHVLRIFGLVRLKENETIIEKIFTRFRVILIILFLTSSFFGKRKFVFQDSIAVTCQFLDRNFVVGSTIVIFSGVFFSHQPHVKVIEALSKVDDVIMETFKIKINYGRIRVLNFIMAFFSLNVVVSSVLILMMIPVQVFNFLAFSCASFLIFFVEIFYVAVTVQILNRILKVEAVLSSSDFSLVHQMQTYKFFQRISDAVKSVNSSLSISILMNFLKHFVKITTRVYIVFHVISYDKQKDVSSKRKNI